MPSRISAALRELAAALEDSEWDQVSVPPSSRPASPVDERSRRERRSEVSQVLAAVSQATAEASASSSTSSACSSRPVGEKKDAGPEARAKASREKPRARPSQSSQALVTGSQVAYREDIRTYVIIANPRQPDRVGCVQGSGSTTWRRLEETLPGGRLSGSAVRLRRVENWQHALQVWEAAHPGTEMPSLQL